MRVTFSRPFGYSLNALYCYVFRNCSCMRNYYSAHFECPHTQLRLCESTSDADKHQRICVDTYEEDTHEFYDHYGGEGRKRYTSTSQGGWGECLTLATHSHPGPDKMKLFPCGEETRFAPKDDPFCTSYHNVVEFNKEEPKCPSLEPFLRQVQQCYPHKFWNSREEHKARAGQPIDLESISVTEVEKRERSKPMWEI